MFVIYGIMSVMDKYQKLLTEWCDYLLSQQITDQSDPYYGGFRCESCDFPHGRADNAVYPFVYLYTLTGEQKYLDGARALLVFRKKLTSEVGSVHNDFSSPWEGITAFSAINLLKTFLYFGKNLPEDFAREVESAATASARWVHENMVVGFHSNVNYYAAASLVNALYASLYKDEGYFKRARELLAYCLNLFTSNGLLSGEAQPHDNRSPNGCLPIDIGYIVEESMPCLLHTAALLEDDDAMDALTHHATYLLNFFLPNGGWDNSFGVRNNKWTYYGSRTSDGCLGMFAALAIRNAEFGEIAERIFRMLRYCTRDGKLYGGPHYFAAKQPACVHHTFCHACALTDAIMEHMQEPRERMWLQIDQEGGEYAYYPEINTYKIHIGPFRATVTGYDYATYTYSNGAAHAGGGTISLLYRDGRGPIIAGSVYEYKPTEKNNMQLPVGNLRHATLLVRAEYEKDGVKYATCLDKNPEIKRNFEVDGVSVSVKARFFAVETQAPENDDLVAEFNYLFDENQVTISVKKINENIKFVMPIIVNSALVFTENRYEKQPIFFLTGGFMADEYTFPLDQDVSVIIR